MECSRPPYTSATGDAPHHLRAVSGMVGTMTVVKTHNDLVYYRNGICVPGSLPFLNFRARALRSPMARLALLLKVKPVFGLFPVEPLESPAAPISMAR